ncbi:MAG: hypothetical protein A2X35_06330 [Elusimicrobia bacterium GWA2_61_42]|nr:MAG: hypothetical protein A2X35_06330 [Elusimicrobia bacterium GWA2_61_42]OGR78768.1 MAG: hypothetical protein A2X38_04275 [Elusimicrobia bacterium GWC2_61_25]
MGKKILIVDDEPEIPAALRLVFEALGYRVEVCSSGLEVMETLRSFKPDLMVMDVMLPGIDGYSLAAKISDDAEFSGLPLIVMSSLEASKCMFERFPQVISYFAKPFSPGDLAEAVKAAFAKK